LVELASNKTDLQRKSPFSLPTTGWPGTCCRSNAHPQKGEPMTTQIPKTVALGERILAVFDKAAEYSADPQEVSHLATQTLDGRETDQRETTRFSLRCSARQRRRRRLRRPKCIGEGGPHD
jgi:hypothetical protein